MQEKRLALILVREKNNNPDTSSMAECTNVRKGYVTEVVLHTISTKVCATAVAKRSKRVNLLFFLKNC